MKFEVFMIILACILIYLNLCCINVGGIIGITVAIYGTFIIFYLKKISDGINNKK